MAGAGYKIWSAGDVLAAADVNTYLMEQAIMVFPGSAQRTSSIATPTAGMVSYLTATKSLEYFDGTNWAVVNDNVDAVPKNTVTTQGDLIVATGSAAVTRLGRGTAGQVLTANSTAIAWQTPTTPVPLNTVTANGDLIVANGSASVTRLGIGANGQYLSSLGTALAWANIAGGANSYIIPADTVISLGTAGFVPGDVWLYQAENVVTVTFANSGGTVLLSDTGSLGYFTIPAAISTVSIANDDTTETLVQLSNITALTPSAEKNYYYITSSTDVVLDTNYVAHLIGGGGAGGGVSTNGDRGGGGGGGSGYYTFGTLTAGTYTATIGAGGAGVSAGTGNTGGATTIGTLTANGGLGGLPCIARGSGGNGGNGGSGGAGGGGGASGTTTTNINAISGALGSNGAAGTSVSTGTGGAGGTGSGVVPSNPIALFAYTLLDPADTGVSTASSVGSGGGIYAGGGGGGYQSSTSAGSNGSGRGGGGGGARGDDTTPAAVAGGNGSGGAIVLIEV